MAKEIPLTRGAVAIVDDEDYEFLMYWNWGLTQHGYAMQQAWGKEYMHRLLMRPKQGMVVDHINMDKLDNRRANLRCCHHSNNAFNKKKRKDERPFKGVFWDKRVKRWMAQVCYGRTSVYLGRYHDPAEAAIAYDFGAIMLFGEFARLNFPEK